MADANIAEVFSRPNTEAKIHDLEQYTLWTDTPNRPGFRSRMAFGERNGAPRITVFTNATEGPAVLVAGFAPIVFEQFLNDFRDMVMTAGPQKREIENLQPDPTVQMDKKTNRDSVAKVVKNTLLFGKTEDGIIWLGIQQKDALNIAFKIMPSVWHVFKRADGTQVSPEEMSKRTALSMIESLRRAMDRWTSRIKPAWTPDPSKRKGGATIDSVAPSFDVSTDIGF